MTLLAAWRDEAAAFSLTVPPFALFPDAFGAVVRGAFTDAFTGTSACIRAVFCDGLAGSPRVDAAVFLPAGVAAAAAAIGDIVPGRPAKTVAATTDNKAAKVPELLISLSEEEPDCIVKCFRQSGS